MKNKNQTEGVLAAIAYLLGKKKLSLDELKNIIITTKKEIHESKKND